MYECMYVCMYVNMYVHVYACSKPGRVAQSVAHLSRKSGVLGSIPGSILSFLLPLFQEGQLSVTGESMLKKYWLTA